MEKIQKIEKLYSNVLMSGLRHLNLVEVQAGLTWDAVMKHRIYSCPGSMEYMFVFDATDLLLKNRATGFRVPLNVESVQVCNLPDPNFIEKVPEKYRARLTRYRDAVQNIPGILNGHHFHRFYFLSNEPWPEWLQKLTASVSETEWSAILSIPYVPKKPLALEYKGCPLRSTYEPDFICHEKIVLELKAVTELTDEPRAQVQNYLKATGLKLGLLVNFGHYPKAQVERIVAERGRYENKDQKS